jgi:hypothetical protein
MNVWTLAIIIAVALILATVVTLGDRLFRGTQRTERFFRCPAKSRYVTVEFEETVWDGQLVDVTRCSAFTPPTVVDCDKRCLATQRLVPGPRVPVGYA